MTKTTRMLVLAAGLTLGVAAAARAQTADDQAPPAQTPPPASTAPKSQTPKSATPTPPPSKRLYVDINAGGQFASRDIGTNSTQTIYDETATITSTQKVGSGGLFDIAAGYQVWRDLSVGLAFTYSSNKSDAQFSATIPNPLFTDQPKTTTGTFPGLKHSERAVHVQVMWTSPINDKMDASIELGPSFISVHQDMITSVTVPAGTQDANAVQGPESKTVVGFQIGGDITYLIRPRYGVGAMARYVVGKADLGPVTGLTVGGFQLGGGVRLRF